MLSDQEQAAATDEDIRVATLEVIVEEMTDIYWQALESGRPISELGAELIFRLGMPVRTAMDLGIRP